MMSTVKSDPAGSKRWKEFAIGLIPLMLVVLLTMVSAQVPSTATGLPARLSHLHSAVIGLSAAFLAIALGSAFSRRFLRTISLSTGFHFVLGIALLGNLVLILGFFGLVQRFLVSWVSVILLLAFSRSTGRMILEVLRHSKVNLHFGPFTVPVILVFIYMILGLAIALLPIIDYDSYTYHMAYPEKLLELHDVKKIDPLYHYSFAMLNHFVNVFFLAAQAPRAATVLQWVALLLTLWELFLFARSIFGREKAMVPVFIFLASTLPIATATTPKIDTFLTLSSLVFINLGTQSLFFSQKDERISPVPCALAMGINLSVKYSSIVLVALFLFLSTCFLFLQKHTIWKAIQWSLIRIAIAGLIAAPWYLKNHYVYGVGIPLLLRSTESLQKTWFQPELKVDHFVEEDYENIDRFVAGAEEKDPSAVRRLREYFGNQAIWASARNPWKIWDIFLNPYRYTRTGDLFDFIPNYLLILAIFLPVFIMRRFVHPGETDRLFIFIFIFSSLFYIGVMSKSYILRFLLPIYPLLCIISSQVVFEIFRSFSGSKLSRWIACSFIAIPILSCDISASSLFKKRQGLEYLTGMKSESAVTSDTVVALRNWLKMINFMNRMPLASTQILFVYEPRTYNLKCRVLTDDSFFGSAFLQFVARGKTEAGIAQCLREQGFTHVLFATDREHWIASVAGLSGLALLRPAVSFRAFASLYLIPVFSTQTATLYQLRAESSLSHNSEQH